MKPYEPLLLLCLAALGCGDSAAERRTDDDARAEAERDAADESVEVAPELAREAEGEGAEAKAEAVEASEVWPDAEAEEASPDVEADAACEAEGEGSGAPETGEIIEFEEPGYPACRPGDRPLALARDRGELQPADWPRRSVESAVAAPCDVHAYRFAGAAGMELRATLTPLGAERIPPRLQVFDARAVTERHAGILPLVDENSAPGIAATGMLTLDQSGEYLLVVGAADLSSTGAYAAEVECLAGCDRRFTRYPIVFLHGSGGFDSQFHLDCFFRVKDRLLAEGYSAHTLDVASLNGSSVRAAMAEPIIDGILEQTGAARINLIGHSQGGLDARYLISSHGFGDRVGVAVLLATPNHGSIIADIILGYIPGFAMEVIAELVNIYGIIVGTGNEQDTLAAAEWLSVRHMQDEFNPSNPDDPRVSYWSWAGETCARTDLECVDSHDGEVVDPLLVPTYRILRDAGDDEHFGISDGLVVPASARWGEFQGIVFADHMDEIGQIADINNQPFDHLGFFSEVARKMYEEGF